MSNQRLLMKITQYLQAKYIKTGINDPVEWKPLAAKLSVTEDQLFDALNIALTGTRSPLDLKPAGMNRIQLGARSLGRADVERKKMFMDSAPSLSMEREQSPAWFICEL